MTIALLLHKFITVAYRFGMLLYLIGVLFALLLMFGRLHAPVAPRPLPAAPAALPANPEQTTVPTVAPPLRSRLVRRPWPSRRFSPSRHQTW